MKSKLMSSKALMKTEILPLKKVIGLKKMRKTMKKELKKSSLSSKNTKPTIQKLS
jgi:hypothetical protein